MEFIIPTLLLLFVVIFYGRVGFDQMPTVKKSQFTVRIKYGSGLFFDKVASERKYLFKLCSLGGEYFLMRLVRLVDLLFND